MSSTAPVLGCSWAAKSAPELPQLTKQLSAPELPRLTKQQLAERRDKELEALVERKRQKQAQEQEKRARAQRLRVSLRSKVLGSSLAPAMRVSSSERSG